MEERLAETPKRIEHTIPGGSTGSRGLRGKLVPDEDGTLGHPGPARGAPRPGLPRAPPATDPRRLPPGARPQRLLGRCRRRPAARAQPRRPGPPPSPRRRQPAASGSAARRARRSLQERTQYFSLQCGGSAAGRIAGGPARARADRDATHGRAPLSRSNAFIRPLVGRSGAGGRRRAARRADQRASVGPTAAPRHTSPRLSRAKLPGDRPSAAPTVRSRPAPAGGPFR